MNCEEWKNKILCMHYSELKEEQISEVRRHLKECDECIRFQEEVESTASLLDQWEIQSTPVELDEIHECIPKESFWTKFSAKWQWAGATIISLIALIVLVFSLLGTEIQWQDRTLTVRFTSTEKSESDTDKTELIRTLIQQQQVLISELSEQKKTLSEVVEALQNDQKRQDAELRTLAEILQSQRQFDRVQFREAIEVLAEEMDNRTVYTQATLNWLVNNQAQIQEIKYNEE